MFQQGNIITADNLKSVPSAHTGSLCQLLGHKHQNTLGKTYTKVLCSVYIGKEWGKKDKKYYFEMQKECHSRTVNMWPCRSHYVMGESASQQKFVWKTLDYENYAVL